MIAQAIHPCPEVFPPSKPMRQRLVRWGGCLHLGPLRLVQSLADRLGGISGVDGSRCFSGSAHAGHQLTRPDGWQKQQSPCCCLRWKPPWGRGRKHEQGLLSRFPRQQPQSKTVLSACQASALYAGLPQWRYYFWAHISQLHGRTKVLLLLFRLKLSQESRLRPVEVILPKIRTFWNGRW